MRLLITLVGRDALIPPWAKRGGLAVKPMRQIHLIHRFAVPLEVNCREAAREATLGCPLEGKAKSLSLLRSVQRGDSSLRSE